MGQWFVFLTNDINILKLLIFGTSSSLVSFIQDTIKFQKGINANSKDTDFLTIDPRIIIFLFFF